MMLPVIKNNRIPAFITAENDFLHNMMDGLDLVVSTRAYGMWCSSYEASVRAAFYSHRHPNSAAVIADI
jgi:hypothetical protein